MLTRLVYSQEYYWNRFSVDKEDYEFYILLQVDFE